MLFFIIIIIFFFLMNKTFCSSLISDLHIFRFSSSSTIIKRKLEIPNSVLSYSTNGASCQLPHQFRNLNIQLPSFSMNAMEFERDLSGSMMHTFGYFCILYRKRFSFYSNFTFLHNFNSPDLCSAKCIPTICKVWLLLSFIYLCFPFFLWIFFIF